MEFWASDVVRQMIATQPTFRWNQFKQIDVNELRRSLSSHVTRHCVPLRETFSTVPLRVCFFAPRLPNSLSWTRLPA